MRDTHIKQNNTRLVTAIGLKNLPLTGKLCAVSTADWKIKLGKLTLKLNKDIPILEIEKFVEDLLAFDITTPMESEYYEDVNIVFVTDKTVVAGTEVEDFIGAVFYNKFGIVLKIGADIPSNTFEPPSYVFRYYPQNLSMSAGNFNLLDMTNNI